MVFVLERLEGEPTSFNPFSTDGTLKYRSIKMLLLIFCIDFLEILVKSFFYNI